MMLMKKTRLIRKTLAAVIAALALSLVVQPALAQTPAERGLEISQESKRLDVGWGDSTSDMVMVLRNNQGQESIREIKNKSLEQPQDGDKSISIFDRPKDVKGTAFLSFSHPVGADDQWLYLPSLKRVKRISSKNKSGPFMGSEFSFEDLSSFEVAKYSYQYLGDEQFNGVDCYKVEQFPVDENSGYTRRIVWIDKAYYRLQKADFYDRKNALLKTLSYHDYKHYLDKFWRADNAKMVNHQTGKSTELKWQNYAFKTGLKESDFSKSGLRRAR